MTTLRRWVALATCACSIGLGISGPYPLAAQPTASKATVPARPAQPSTIKASAPASSAAQPSTKASVPPPGAAPSAAPAAAARTPVLMWQVRSPTATVYLLGSVHVGSADAYPLDPRIERAFAESDTLVLEVPLDEAAMANAAAIMQQRGLYAPPDSLDKHLDPATLAKLKTAIEATGMPVQPFMQMRPWFVAMTIALLRLQADGFEPKYGIDVHFHAAGKDKRFHALETIEAQAGLLSGMPVKLQVDNLRQTLEELDQAGPMMRAAFAAWRRGDGAAIDELMLGPFRKRYPALYRRLFVDRNRRMAKAVTRLLAGKGTSFVVVGAGHLVGNDSIIRMLTTRSRRPQQL